EVPVLEQREDLDRGAHCGVLRQHRHEQQADHFARLNRSSSAARLRWARTSSTSCTGSYGLAITSSPPAASASSRMSNELAVVRNTTGKNGRATHSSRS